MTEMKEGREIASKRDRNGKTKIETEGGGRNKEERRGEDGQNSVLVQLEDLISRSRAACLIKDRYLSILLHPLLVPPSNHHPIGPPYSPSATQQVIKFSYLEDLDWPVLPAPYLIRSIFSLVTFRPSVRPRSSRFDSLQISKVDPDPRVFAEKQ